MLVSRRTFIALQRLYHVENKNIDATKYELSQKQIDEAIKTEPVLSSASRELWQKTHDTFANHGIITSSFIQMIIQNPSLLSRNPTKIKEILETWRSCQFGENHLHQLLTKYPQLLDIKNGQDLLVKTTFIREFVGTTKNVWRLLMNSPSLVKENRNSIEKKFDYLTKVMRIEIPEIVKSEVFSKSLDEIKCRHVFLERLGLFKPRSPKADPNEPSKNPRLHLIMDTTDKMFATKVAFVSLAEFEAFQELYRRELEKDDESDFSDDEDEL